MRLASYKGPLLLLAWQIVPVSVGPDSAGRFQVTVGWGGGQFEDRSVGCSGEVFSAEPVPFNAGGVQLDYWPSDQVRLSGFGGTLTENGVRSGWGGAQAALETRYVGLGLGVASMSFQEVYGAVPSAYVRLGSRDHVHFRMDAFHPTTAVGATGDVFRIGVGFNQGLRRGTRGFFGFNFGPYADQSGHGGGVFGEFAAPIVSRVDLSVGGSWRPSTEEFDGGIRAGLRYHFRR
jgi:hypothetical protein